MSGQSCKVKADAAVSIVVTSLKGLQQIHSIQKGRDLHEEKNGRSFDLPSGKDCCHVVQLKGQDGLSPLQKALQQMSL